MGGDKSGYMLVCTVYILVGMTVFTTIIEIVRRQYVSTHLHVQGVPYYWAHFVFVIFSGSRAHTEELFIAIG